MKVLNKTILFDFFPELFEMPLVGYNQSIYFIDLAWSTASSINKQSSSVIYLCITSIFHGYEVLWGVIEGLNSSDCFSVVWDSLYNLTLMFRLPS